MALTYLQVDPDYELWKLGPIAKKLSSGGVGVIPTDTVYAFVCDLGDKAAIERLYAIKQLDPKKPLAILCKDLAAIAEYTRGVPNNHFRALRRCVPGPFTFILQASAAVPKLMLTGKRRELGVRIPADPICHELLEQLERPLLCTSVRAPDDSFWNNPAEIADTYGKRLDFVVDGGERLYEPSTVISLLEDEPEVLRLGKGDPELFV